MPEMMVSSTEDPRVGILEGKLSEIEDFQLLNKLDIIAIKEQLEHIEKLSQALTPETQQRLAWVEQVTKSDKFQSIEKLIEEIHNIESTLSQAKTGLSEEQIENLKNEVSKKVEQDVSLLKQKLENAPLGKIAASTGPDINITGLENTVLELKTKISELEKIRNVNTPSVTLTGGFKEEIMKEFDAKLQAASNKIYSDIRSNTQIISKLSTNDPQSTKALMDLRNDMESMRSDIKNDVESKFNDLETRMKSMEPSGDMDARVKQEIEKIGDQTMHDINEKMDQLQLTMSKSGMEDTKREIYEDFHKFKISIIDQISKSAEDVENKVMPQINTWRMDADKALQKNKDAYAELVKYKLSSMDEMSKKTQEIKDSLMAQLPVEVHSIRVDIDKKLDQFQQQVSEIKILKADVEDFRKKLERSKVGELDKITAEVDRVKARSEWLEDELLKKDITSIVERMNELETEIQKTKAMIPIVLE